MKLVHLDNFLLTVEDELLLLKPFRKLYKSDRTRNKEYFYDLISMIYFIYDPRSDYNYIIDEELRHKEVCESNGYEYKDFNSAELECIELYKKLTVTASQELLASTRIAINKVRTFLETVDLNEKDDKGKPIYTINSITTAIKLIPLLAKDVMEAEKAVVKEIEEQGRARGGNESLSIMDSGALR